MDNETKLHHAERKIQEQRETIRQLSEQLEFYRACYDNGPHAFDGPALTPDDVIELNKARKQLADDLKETMP